MELRGVVAVAPQSVAQGDTWGSVLAMADLLLNAEARLADRGADPAEVKKWTAPIAEEVKEMLAEQGTDHDKVLGHLMSSKIEPWARGVKWTVETLIMVAANWPIPAEIEAQIPRDGPNAMSAQRANSGLIANGFRVVKATRPKRRDETVEPDEQLYLACHKDHRGSKEVFEDTIYKNNGHLQQFEQVPGAYSTRLEALGLAGRVGACLFRAQKASERAKVYRGGGYRRMAYDRKDNALDDLAAALEVLADEGEGLTWGWGADPAQPKHCHVLYVDLPTGQVSFHTGERGDGPPYPGAWDGRPRQSPDRILRWCARLLDGRA